MAGLRWLQEGRPSRVFCLGSGSGFTVREVIAAAAEVTGTPVPVTEGPRRAGDAVALVSGSARAMAELGWEPRRSSLVQMITDAWRWHRGNGYGS